MRLENWTGLHVMAIMFLYWVVLAATWRVRTARPEAQARARERALRQRAVDPATGEMTMTFEHSIDLERLAVIIFGPPLLLVAGWLLLRV